MTAATQVITSFLGGEISQYAQGRYDRPDYRTSMRVCLNSFPIESGAWTRRPGFRYAGHSRLGLPARTIKFDFQQSSPITLEFTDSKLRFRNGAVLITANDAQTVVAVSAANPAVVQVASAVTWATGDTLVFPNASTPLLEARQFTATQIDNQHFALADALTGVSIDGSTLGALAAGAMVERVQELTTVYTASTWDNLRAVQAETTDILLTPDLAPQMLTVTTLPTSLANAEFAISAAVLNDGPYLDPFINGVQATPTAKSGVITITLSFAAYDSTKAYAKGAFVTSSSVNYISLADQNVGNTPVSSPTFWATTSAGAAIGTNGFQGSDIGRLVRLFSEPPLWQSGSTYGTSSVVSYNPSGVPGATTYWQSKTGSNTGNAPGADLTNWSIIASGAAIWSWGKITALSNVISRSSGSAIGTMTSSGGLSASFDGTFSKPYATSSEFFVSTSGSFGQGAQAGLGGCYVGKDFVGSPQTIKQAIVYPSSDQGILFGTYRESFSGNNVAFSVLTLVVSLRGSMVAPTSPSSGTLLATTGNIGNSVSSITLTSTDQTTAFRYVWVEVEGSATFGAPSTSFTLASAISQISFFSPNGTGTGDGVNVEILGAPLLYTNAVTTWRLGAYSDTTGWPSCGCYDGGRLYLGGAIANRWDACVSNGIVGSTINFAPTDQYGVVATSNAISYTFNSDGVNPILWMSPELQGVLMGTQAGEWLVQAPTTGPIAPANVSARRMTKIGCANVEPRRTEHTTILVKRYGRKLMEYFADVYSGKYSAPNLADKAQHITSPGVAELAYTEAVNPVVWGRNDDGGLFGVTYKRDALNSSQGPTFYGWHQHTLGSGRLVESICAGPSTGGDLDTLTIVTKDTASSVRHIEVLTDTPDELTTFANCWFLDDAVNPTSISTTVTPSGGAPFGGMMINGLWHLNGKTVQVFAGGLDCGDRGDLNAITDFTVSNGSVFVPFGDGISGGPGKGLFTQAFATSLPLTQIVVGFTYNSDGQIVRLIAQADTGARNGPALGAPSRTHRAALKLVNTTGLSFGGNFDRLYPCIFMMNGASATKLGTLSLFSGTFYDQVRDDFTYEDSLCWRVSRPYPATITAAGVNLRTEDM